MFFTPPARRHALLRQRNGVTAIESLVAIAIVSIAGGAMLASHASAVQSGREIALMTVARGLADQLLEEVAASPVPTQAATTTPTGPRMNFTTIDHFNGWSESPPQDRYGRVLGTEGEALSGSSSVRRAEMQADMTLLSRFRRSITIEKVLPTGGTWTTTSSESLFRRVTVRVVFADDERQRELAVASRIVAYVAPTL
jgi:prepilin-type N-terminal cleavage/methylation domain-containing protein